MESLNRSDRRALSQHLDPEWSARDPDGRLVALQRRWSISHIVRRRIEEGDLSRENVKQFLAEIRSAIESPRVIAEQDLARRPNEWADKVFFYYECSRVLREPVLRALVIPLPIIPQALADLRPAAGVIASEVDCWWVKTVFGRHQMNERSIWLRRRPLRPEDGIFEPCPTRPKGRRVKRHAIEERVSHETIKELYGMFEPDIREGLGGNGEQGS